MYYLTFSVVRVQGLLSGSSHKRLTNLQSESGMCILTWKVQCRRVYVQAYSGCWHGQLSFLLAISERLSYTLEGILTP